MKAKASLGYRRTKEGGARERGKGDAEWVKALVLESDAQSSISRTHMKVK